MAISTTVGVRDNLSTAFRNMTASINVCLSTFAEMQTATNEGISARNMEEVHRAMNNMNASAEIFTQELGQAEQQQRRVNNSISQGSNVMNQLTSKVRNLISAYAGWKAVDKVMDLSDSLGSATAKVNMMNRNFDETGDTMGKIYKTAQASRMSYIDLANTVSKIGTNSRDAFDSTDEVIEFTSLIQKGFVSAGTGVIEAQNAMLQLTQAMGSGVLRGEELNSIYEQAPQLIQYIADYMEVPKTKIRELASEGQISADIVKNAMFSASKQINSDFANMPVTFSQAATCIKNASIVTFQPILNMIGAITQSESFAVFAQGVVGAFQSIAEVAQPVLQFIIDGGAWIVENWGQIEPILAGATAALITYVGWQAISKLLDSEGIVMKVASTVATLAQGTAMLFYGLAVGSATIAQAGLNMVLSACPLLFVIMLIGLVVAAIARWVQSVGGIKVAWLICVDKVLYGWDMLKIGFTQGVHAVQNQCDLMKVAFTNAKASIVTTVGNMKVSVLTAIQNMVNGAIDLINDFISTLNKIPGVSIDAISYTASFATDAAAEEAKKQSAAAEEVASAQASYETNKQARAQSDADKTIQAYADHNKRLQEIATAQKKAKEKNNDKASYKIPTSALSGGASTPYASTGGVGGSDPAGVGKNTGKTAANTSKIADSLEVAEDNLEWMKDIAEREIIDRTVFRDIKVSLGSVNNTVNNMSDLDGIADYIGDSILERVQIGAEGAY